MLILGCGKESTPQGLKLGMTQNQVQDFLGVSLNNNEDKINDEDEIEFMISFSEGVVCEITIVTGKPALRHNNVEIRKSTRRVQTFGSCWGGAL